MPFQYLEDNAITEWEAQGNPNNVSSPYPNHCSDYNFNW